MDLGEQKVVGGLILRKIKWYITARRTARHHVAYWANPSCLSCETDLKAEGDTLTCPNPQCKAQGKIIKLDEPLNNVQTLALKVWEGEQRRSSKDFKWINADQQLVRLAEASADNDDKYWAQASFYKTPEGKLLMILLGKKGDEAKIQLFVKDELDMVAHDQLGDLNPKELLMGFKAYFSDGSTTETKFKS